MGLKHYFWDSCVFIAYLNNDIKAYDINSLEQFINECKQKDGCKIYTSSIALAEVTPKRLIKSKYGNFEEFMRDFRGFITVIEASPIICSTAGRLKDIPYNKNNSKKRILTTGDAIMLATVLELESTFNTTIDAFHTYDNGRGKGNPEGKGVPLLSYQGKRCVVPTCFP